MANGNQRLRGMRENQLLELGWMALEASLSCSTNAEYNRQNVSYLVVCLLDRLFAVWRKFLKLQE
jgi:hypothetical protein